MKLNEYHDKAMSTNVESSDNIVYSLLGLNAEVGEINDKIARTMNWNPMNETANLKDGEQMVVRMTWSIDPTRPIYTIGKMFNGTPFAPGREYNLDCFTKEWCRINADATGWRDMSTLSDAPACQPILLRYELRGEERYEIVYKSLGGDISYPPTPQRTGWMLLSDNLGEAI